MYDKINVTWNFAYENIWISISKYDWYIKSENFNKNVDDDR